MHFCIKLVEETITTLQLKALNQPIQSRKREDLKRKRLTEFRDIVICEERQKDFEACQTAVRPSQPAEAS